MRARSWRTYLTKGLAGVRDLGHQTGCSLQIPIGVRNVGMTEIGAQSEDVARYGVIVAWTPFQRPYGEGVPQIVDAWPRPPGSPLSPILREICRNSPLTVS